MNVNFNESNIGKVILSDTINYYENNEWREYVQERKVSKKKTLKVFLSYSHLDKDMKSKLDSHLERLKKSYQAVIWSDSEIYAGKEWDIEIKRELNEADVIIMMITESFITSEYISNVELPRAIERHNLQIATVIPIFCKACDYKNMPFAKIQGLPAIPINSAPNIDKAFTEVVDGISVIFENLLNTRL